MSIIKTADFTPDAPAYLNINAPDISGVYPRSDGSDGPILWPLRVSSAMPGSPRGLFTAAGNIGSSFVVGGNENGLFQLQRAGWLARGAGYNVQAGDHWRFTQFGTHVLACNGFDPLQYWDTGSGDDFQRVPDAPASRFVATVEPGFVMLGAYDTGNEFVENGIRWSVQNNDMSWPTVGTSDAIAGQSDEQALSLGGQVTGIIPAIGGSACAVFTQQAIYRLDYVGPPVVFTIREIDRSRGNVCPNGIANIGSIAAFIAEDGFYVTDASGTPTAIGNGRVNRFFWQQVNRARLDLVFATVDLSREIVVWSFPRSGSDMPDAWLIWNYTANRWRFCDEASVGASYASQSRAIGWNLDELDDNPLFQNGGIDDPAAPSLDSPSLIGGAAILAGFDAQGYLVSFEGKTLDARISTGETDADGKLVYVSALRPLTDAKNVRARVLWRPNFDAEMIATALTGSDAMGACPQRVAARYVRAQVIIPAGEEWSYYQGVDVTMAAKGKR